MKPRKAFPSLVFGMFIWFFLAHMAFLTGPAYAVSYLVQSSETQLSAVQTTKTVPLGTPVDKSQSFFLLFPSNNQDVNTKPSRFLVNGGLTADGTGLSLVRNESGEIANVSYSVVQHPNITVQDDAYELSAGVSAANIPISSVDTSKSIVILHRGSAAGINNHSDSQVTGYLTSPTILRIERDTTVTACRVTWQVVTFTDATTVQTNERIFGDAEKLATVTLGTPVDLSRSWVYFTVRSSGGSGMAYTIVRGRILNTTTLQFQRWNAVAGVVPKVRWFVMEFPSGLGANVQRGLVNTVAITDTILNAPISAVDTSKTFLYHTSRGSGTGNSYPRPYWINRFSTTTNAQFQRWRTGKNGGIMWCAVRMHACPPSPGMPSNPDPLVGATDVSVTAVLDWADCSDTDTYEVYLDTNPTPTTKVGETSSSSYDPDLAYSTDYYWKIIAKNACDSTEGLVWNFRTEPCLTPGTPITPSPSIGATGVSVNAILDWADCSNTDTYEVYLDTNPTPTTKVADTSSSTYDPDLAYDTHYYWKIIAKNGCDSTEGPVWDFTTEPCPTPGTPGTPSPGIGALGVSVNAVLDWADCSDTDTYEVYLDTNPTPTTKVADTSSSSYDPDLDWGTHYYWKIITKNDCGNSTEGPVWDFTTEPCPTPGTPSGPTPGIGATGVLVSAIIDWADCSNTDTYEVYLDTSSPPTTKVGETSSSSYDPDLAYGTDYYWKIIAKNDCGNSTEGLVWNFTTEPCPIPGTPSGPSPGIGATGVSVSAVLDWANCSDTNTYEVYLDTNPTPTTKVGETSSSTYDPDLNWDTHYYWKIIAKNDCGNSTEGPVWDFTTGPDPGGDHLVWPSSPTPLSPYSDWDTAAHTIADAVTAAVASPKLGTKTVLVRAGTSYSERVFMRDEVDVIAEAGVKPFIAAAGGTFTGVVEFNQPITCTVRGFTIQNNSSMGSAVHVDGSGGQVNATIEDCTMNYSPSFGRGIALEGTVNVTIKDCNVYRNGGGWRLGIGTSDMFGETIAANSSITIKGTTVGGASGEGFTQAGIRLNGAGAGIQVTIGGSSAGDRNTISYNGRAGIRLVNIEQVTIENNDISNNSYAGIRIDNTSQLSIDGNDISNNSYAGIRLDNVAQLSIDNNDISNNLRTGVLLLDANTVSPHIRNNNIHNHVGEAGINIGGASNVTIGDNNNIYSNKAGIVFYVSNNTNIDGGTRTKSSQPVTITGNNIFSNTYAGIAVRDGISGALTITQNNIYSNTRGGIRMQRKCTLNISRNTIRDNLRGGIHTGSDAADGGGFAAAQIGLGLLTIEKNKIYDNGQGNMGGGINVRHMPGTIYNNLIYGNHRGGIRFGDYITQIVNNTVVNNGELDFGGGIIYDDLAGAVNDPPAGVPPAPLFIRNNICAYNVKAGIRTCFDNTEGSEERDYNLLYANYPWNDIFSRSNSENCGWPDLDDMSCIKQQYGGCGAYFVKGVGILLDAPNDIIANPLFKVAPNDYRLQRLSEGDGSDSPAINAGDDNLDMGCYGGSEPLDW